MTTTPPTSLQFTEEMKGHVTFGETDFALGAESARADRRYFMFHLTIHIADLDRFLDLPSHQGTAEGWVQCDALGGQRHVEQGTFNLFVDTDRPAERRMLYRLFIRDEADQPMTMSGFKVIKDDGVDRIWHDTSTLYTKLLSGHVSADEEAGATVLAAGILIIQKADFAHQMTTFRVDGPTLAGRVAAATRFGKFFLGSLWEIYGIQMLPHPQ